MVNLGVLEYGAGNVDVARDWYRRAVESGHDDWAPNAMVNLGVLEDEAGNVDVARDWYRRAVESGHDDWAPKAMFNLAATCHALSGFTVARNWYTRAIEADSAEVSAFAALRLGDLELDIVGDPYAARAAYERAVAFDDPEQSPLAQLRMARLDAMELDDEAAEGRLGALAGVLLDSQIHAEILAIAGRLEHVERFAAAERWLQRVPSSSPLATAASLQLAGMFRRLGRGDDAYEIEA
ncbi:MAG: tetratricopeptide repeat protein [Actinobacteria bacterium]|nr:tetratricopeptide repeat protein [Actinomycetota bacterium]